MRRCRNRREAIQKTPELVARIALLKEQNPGWTQQRIAVEIGISASAVQKWARGAGIPGLTRAEAGRRGAQGNRRRGALAQVFKA